MRGAKISIYISKLKQGNFIIIFSGKCRIREEIFRDNLGGFFFQGESACYPDLHMLPTQSL